jgi:putative endonuclease
MDPSVGFASLKDDDKWLLIFNTNNIASKSHLYLQHMKQPAVYILTNKKNGTLYTGVSSNLIKRVFEHKEGVVNGFSKRYGCKTLVFYEVSDSIISAIEREKQIKGWLRSKKIELIESMNPEWSDLYDSIC